VWVASAGSGRLASENESGRSARNEAARLDFPWAGRNFASTQVFFQNVNAIAVSEPRGGAAMPNRARLIYRCLKLVIFIAVWIALAWSVWRLLF
jgi:hypothetical protein